MNLLHSKAVVVGIDGSKAAIRAALWAVDEALNRDIPLRLLYAVQQGDDIRGAQQNTVAVAETAIHRAFTAIEATGRPVKIEPEIVHGSPVELLIRASASAAIVCVGAIGLRHFQAGHIGSTAAALAISARCPVAIIRGRDKQPGQATPGIVVELDGSPDNGLLLGTAMEEGQLRNAAIRAVVCGHTMAADDEAAHDFDRRARPDLDRRLARWRRQYPNLRMEAVVAYGNLLDYLTHNHGSAQLVIVGAANRELVDELVGPTGNAILQDAQCSLLIVNRQHL